MILKFKCAFVLLFAITNLFCQKSKHPKNLAKYCDITKREDGAYVLRNKKLPIDFIGAARPEGYTVVAACKGEKKINIIIEFLGSEKSKGRGGLLVYTAIKEKGKWTQKVAKNLFVVAGPRPQDKKLIDCFFADMNTLFIGYEFPEGNKEAYLIRFTEKGQRVYRPHGNPYKHNPLYIKIWDEKKLLASPRPKH